MKRLTWKQFTEDSVPSGRRGVYCLNSEILDSINQNEVGFYIYTDETNYKKNKYKCGQSIRGLSRLKEQAQQSEKLMVVDWIPSDDAHIGKRDQQIHEELHDEGKSQWLYRLDKESSPGKEWSVFPDNNPGEIWWDKLSGKQTRIELGLTYWQIKSLERIVKSLSEGNKLVMAELAARFGKTTTYLSLLDIVQSKVMVIGSYVLTVSSSFKKECRQFSQFSNMEFLELNSPTFKEDFDELMNTDKQIVIFASLCGGSLVEKNSDILSQVDDKLVVIDEADFGAHTEQKVPLVQKITGDSPLVLTTGTNSERARGQHDVDDMFRVTYFDMLMMKDR